MNTIFKTTTYIFISCFVSYIVSIGTGSFFDEFRDNSVTFLATILAICISATTLISGELSKLRRNYSTAKISNVFKNLKRIVVTQIILIVVLLILLVIKDAIPINNDTESFRLWYSRFCDTYIVYAMLYCFEVIYSLAEGLMNLLNYNNSINNDN